MEAICDNKSVGVIIRNTQNKVLLIDRARFPFGLAAPAGHIDEHGSEAQTAIQEVFEEVGLMLPLVGLRKVISSRRIENTCRRLGGDYHDWTVFMADGITGTPVSNNDEIINSNWYSPRELQVLADKSVSFKGIQIEKGQQLLEPIWLGFLSELGIVAIDSEHTTEVYRCR